MTERREVVPLAIGGIDQATHPQIKRVEWSMRQSGRGWKAKTPEARLRPILFGKKMRSGQGGRKQTAPVRFLTDRPVSKLSSRTQIDRNTHFHRQVSWGCTSDPGLSTDYVEFVSHPISQIGCQPYRSQEHASSVD